jgi:hypothetical protein
MLLENIECCTHVYKQFGSEGEDVLAEDEIWMFSSSVHGAAL